MFVYPVKVFFFDSRLSMIFILTSAIIIQACKTLGFILERLENFLTCSITVWHGAILNTVGELIVQYRIDLFYYRRGNIDSG